MGPRRKSMQITTLGLDSDEGADCVVDVVVGDIAGVAGNAVVCLDVVQGFDVPGGGQFEGAVDFIETSDEVFIDGAGATSNQAVGDLTEVVTDVTGTLGLTTGVGSVVAPLHLGGVGELAVDSLGSTVHQGIGIGGERLSGFKSVFGALETTEGGVQLGLAKEAALGIGC